MRILPTPPRQDFAVYIARPEVHFCEREGDEPLEALYTRGYLPYSGAQDLHNIFYSARSARIVLPEFEMSSENRRIAKKFDGKFTKERIAYADIGRDNVFVEFVLQYFRERHDPGAMPRERLEVILQSGIVSTVVRYSESGVVRGYVLEVEAPGMRHYWYSAYDLTLMHQSLGLWLMLDCLRDAKAAGAEHYYLGTVYGAKALYKTNFAPLEWWSGTAWSRDVAALKHNARAD